MDVSETAGASLPAWITGPGVVFASFVASWFVTRLGTSIALRGFPGPEGTSWVEQARLAYPARRTVTIYLGLLPLAMGIFVGSRIASELGLFSARLWGSLAAISSLIGVMTFYHVMEQRIGRVARPDKSPRRGITIVVLMYLPMLIPFGVMIGLMPDRWGWGSIAVSVLGVALTTIQIRGGSILLLQRLGLARPASARLQSIVDRLASTTGVVPRATFELDSPQANALAWPIPMYLVFTSQILDDLDDDQLASVTAHELGHLNEPWSAYLFRIISAYFLITCAITLPLLKSYGLLVGLTPFGLMLVTVLIAKRVGRKMEERSDRMGLAHEGEVEGTYARALELIYRSNLMPVVMKGKRHVHPDLYDRLVSAGLPPDYQRPGPPPRSILALLPVTLLMIAAECCVISALVSTNREAHKLAARADALLIAGSSEAASRLYRQAAELDPATPHHQANLALTLLHLHRPDEAETANNAAEDALRHLESDEAANNQSADFSVNRKQLRATIEATREGIERARLINTSPFLEPEGN